MYEKLRDQKSTDQFFSSYNKWNPNLLVLARVGNERARSSSGENERKDFRAKSSSGENERKDFRAEPSSGENIFERDRVRAMLEHVSSKSRASSMSNFGQIRACFISDFGRSRVSTLLKVLHKVKLVDKLISTLFLI